MSTTPCPTCGQPMPEQGRRDAVLGKPILPALKGGTVILTGPGTGWKLSAEAQEEIENIERCQVRAAASLRDFRLD